MANAGKCIGILAVAALAGQGEAIFPDVPTMGFPFVFETATSATQTLATGIALGPCCLLTCAHGGATGVVIDGEYVAADHTETHETADLRMLCWDRSVFAQSCAPRFTAVPDGTEVTFVGFGGTSTRRPDGTGWNPPGQPDGRARTATNRIRAHVPGLQDISGSTTYTYDALNADLTTPGGAGATPNEGGQTPGDSGSPWLVRNGTEYSVIGIYTIALNGNRNRNVYDDGDYRVAVNLASYKTWVETHMVCPEPSTIAAIGLGGAWLLRRRFSSRARRVPRRYYVRILNQPHQDGGSVCSCSSHAASIEAHRSDGSSGAWSLKRRSRLSVARRISTAFLQRAQFWT
jgi:hypothetical protein